MSIRVHVRKLRPLKSYISPVDKIQSFFSEKYSFPSEKEISDSLKDFPH